MSLKNELSKLIENKVISSEMAEKIEQYYNKPKEKKEVSFALFAVLGSILVGLGIILILAHNWDDLPKIVKIILSFLPLVIGQIVVGYSIKKEKSATWKESSGVFLFFAIGASISLIAQTYHISGNLAKFLLTWILASAPLMYLLRSKSLLVLHLILATYFAIEIGYSYWGSAVSPWYYFLFLFIAFPFYIRLFKEDKHSNMVMALHWLVPLSLVISMSSFIDNSYYFFLLLYVSLFVLLLNIGRELSFQGYKTYQNGYYFFGVAGTLLFFTIASFKWVWMIHDHTSLHNPVFYLILGLLFFSFVTILFSAGKKRPFSMGSLAPLVFLAVFLFSYANILVSLVLINIFLLTWAVLQIYQGLQKMNFASTNFGLLIIATLIICRFFDSNLSFVLRGILFLLVGVGFFATNYVLFKKLKKVS